MGDATALADSVIQPTEAGGQLRVQRFLLRELLALLFDDLGGGALDEVRSPELRPHEAKRIVGSLDLLLESLAFRRDIDHAGEIDVELGGADHAEGGALRPARR